MYTCEDIENQLLAIVRSPCDDGFLDRSVFVRLWGIADDVGELVQCCRIERRDDEIVLLCV